MKTWEVLLDTQGNGVVPKTVTADGFEDGGHGITFYKENEDNSNEDVAFFPYTKLLSAREMTP